MCAFLYISLIVCNKIHANPTIIYGNIKEIHIITVGVILEFPILNHVLLHGCTFFCNLDENILMIFFVFNVKPTNQ